MTDGPIRVATRGSALARRQTATVAEALERRRHDVEVVEVATRGDEVRDELISELGSKGAFVRSLDERVLDGDVDLAVHSLKDLPTEFPEDLVVAAVPERAAAGDAVVTPDGTPLSDLPSGATVGTASARRRAQVLSRRPDLEVAPLRGNVDTRVRKLLAPHLRAERERRRDAAESDDGEEFERSVDEWEASLSAVEREALDRDVETEYDAIVLAQAGLDRLGLADEVALDRLDPTETPPSPGQGAVAVTARADGEAAETVRTALDHPRTRVEVTAERVLLEELGGGCIAPIAAHALVQGGNVHLEAAVFGPDGEESVTASRDLDVERYADAARDVAAEMAASGATDLVAAAMEDDDAA